MSLHGLIVLNFVYYHHNDDLPRGMMRAIPPSFTRLEKYRVAVMENVYNLYILTP